MSTEQRTGVGDGKSLAQGREEGRHTPGPWRLDRGDTYRHNVIAQPGAKVLVVARVGVPQTGGTTEQRQEQADANAALIAAAPELRAALRFAANAIEAMNCACTVAELASGHRTVCGLPALHEALGPALAVLAKADGVS